MVHFGNIYYLPVHIVTKTLRGCLYESPVGIINGMGQ